MVTSGMWSLLVGYGSALDDPAHRSGPHDERMRDVPASGTPRRAQPERAAGDRRGGEHGVSLDEVVELEDLGCRKPRLVDGRGLVVLLRVQAALHAAADALH